MLEGFIGVILLCLVDEPNQCMTVSGPIFATEEECRADVLYNGLPYFTDERPDLYIAGLTCVEAQLLGEEV